MQVFTQGLHNRNSLIIRYIKTSRQLYVILINQPWIIFNTMIKTDFNIVLLLMVKKFGLFPLQKEQDIEVKFWSHP